MGSCIVRIVAQTILVVVNAIVQESGRIIPDEQVEFRALSWQKLQPKLSHFISRLDPVLDPFRWTMRIVNVPGRIVVAELHMKRRPFWQGYRTGVAVIPLPIKIPIPNPKQPLLL